MLAPSGTEVNGLMQMLVSQRFSVSRKVVVVTGAASGIGRSIATLMAENDAQVVLADINADALVILEGEMSSMGAKVTSACVDISDREATREFMSGVAARYGKIDVVFANAGVSAGPSFELSSDGEITKLQDASWDKAIAVNLSGTLATIQAAAAAMIPQKSGRVIVTSSISGIRASLVSGYAYVAAKAALNNIVRHACVDLGRHNITINAIAPGYIVTDIANGILKRDAGIRNRLAESVPLGRLGVPEDVAGLALFLASDASSYITGIVIPVDGGAMAK